MTDDQPADCTNDPLDWPPLLPTFADDLKIFGLHASAHVVLPHCDADRTALRVAIDPTTTPTETIAPPPDAPDDATAVLVFTLGPDDARGLRDLLNLATARGAL